MLSKINIFINKFKVYISDVRFSEILSGSVWSLSAQVIATAMGLVFNIIVARLFGAQITGIVTVINSFLLISTVFSTVGTNTSILRLIPEHLAKHSPASAYKVYKSTKHFVIIISLIVSISLFFCANIIADIYFNKPNLTIYLQMTSGLVVFRSLTILNSHVIRGLQLIRIFAIMNILPQLCNLTLLVLLTFVLKNEKVPVYSILSGITVTGILGWLITEHFFNKMINESDLVHPFPIYKILKISLPMFTNSLSFLALSESSVLFLGFYKSESEIGIYSIAIKLATITSFFLTAINTIAAPRFSQLYHSGNMDELFYVAKKSTKLIFWVTAPLLVLLIIYGKQIISIVFGIEFSAAYQALVYLALGQFVNSISGSTGNFLNMTGRHIFFRNLMVTAACINIILNIFLIPKIGITGAAISTMLSECYWNICALVYIKKTHGKTIGYLPFFSLKKAKGL